VIVALAGCGSGMTPVETRGARRASPEVVASETPSTSIAATPMAPNASSDDAYDPAFLIDDPEVLRACGQAFQRLRGATKIDRPMPSELSSLWRDALGASSDAEKRSCSARLYESFTPRPARTVDEEVAPILVALSTRMARAFDPPSGNGDLDNSSLQNVARPSDGAEGSHGMGALCPSAPSVPARLSGILGTAYHSKPADWKRGGWPCLGFSLSEPQRFQYEVFSNGNVGFAVLARGIPEGETHFVEYSIAGRVSEDGTRLLVEPYVSRRP